MPEENGRGTGTAGEDCDAAEMTVTSTCAPQLALSYVGMRCGRPRRSGRRRWSKLMTIQMTMRCSRGSVPGNGARSDRDRLSRVQIGVFFFGQLIITSFSGEQSYIMVCAVRYCTIRTACNANAELS